TGDASLTIDGHTTRLMGAWEATQAVRGKPGSKVTLGINPVTGGDRKNVTLERKAIAVPQPSGDLAGSEIGVVRLANIAEGDARRLSQTVTALQARGMKRLLLDMRRCATATASSWRPGSCSRPPGRSGTARDWSPTWRSRVTRP